MYCVNAVEPPGNEASSNVSSLLMTGAVPLTLTSGTIPATTSPKALSLNIRVMTLSLSRLISEADVLHGYRVALLHFESEVSIDISYCILSRMFSDDGGSNKRLIVLVANEMPLDEEHSFLAERIFRLE